MFPLNILFRRLLPVQDAEHDRKEEEEEKETDVKKDDGVTR